MMVDLGHDLQATYRDGKLMILRRGVVREFRSVSEYLDTVAAMGGRVPPDTTKALREYERLIRSSTSQHQQERGTPHWLI